jgi:hypothetical protein
MARRLWLHVSREHRRMFWPERLQAGSHIRYHAEHEYVLYGAEATPHHDEIQDTQQSLRQSDAFGAADGLP